MPSPFAPSARRFLLRRWALPLALSCVMGSAAWAAPPDSTDGMTWARAAVALRASLDDARAEPDVAAHAAAAFAAARRVAQAPLSPDIRALVLEAQARYETHHGGATLPVRLTAAEFEAVRGDLLVEAVDAAGAPLERGDVVGAVLAERRAAAEAARLAAEVKAARAAEAARIVGAHRPHFEYPAAAQDVMDRQAAIVQRRFRGLGRRLRRVSPAIERTFRRRGIPTELKYVAVIESALDAQAESHAGAAGMWQFMPATAEEFGLDSLSVHDVGASTDAAARYLRQLGRMFGGDWQLALAAYNAGPGRVRKLVRAHRAAHGGTPGFWDIYDALPRETRAYVPRFIAVAEMYGDVRR